jgi:Legionella pneumophila major outer membrane protein precursor
MRSSMKKMDVFMLKRLLIFTSILSVSKMCADSFDDDEFLDQYDYLSYVSSSPQKTTPAITSTTSSISQSRKTHNHFYLKAEALVMNSGVNQLEFGDRVVLSNGVESHYLSSLPRPYNLGFRGTIGAELNGVGWGIKAQGLHFSNYQKKTLQASDTEQYLLYLTYSSNLNDYPPQVLPGGRQKGSYRVNLNIADLVMDVSVVKKKHYELIFDAGARYLNLHQRLNVVNSNIYTVFEDLTGPNIILNSDKISGFGMVVRAHNTFYFTRQFSLDLQGAFSAVYGSEKISNSAIGDPLYNVDKYYGSSFSQYDKEVLPILEFEAQFGYEQSFYDDAFSFNVTLGYFLMDIINGFNGIKIGYTDIQSQEVESTVRFSGDTVLQGLTAGLGFKF